LPFVFTFFVFSCSILQCLNRHNFSLAVMSERDRTCTRCLVWSRTIISNEID
jgi:hypothetical protein